MSKNKNGTLSWGRRNDLVRKDRTRMRLCIICGKQAIKGHYCQSCADFIRMMKKRDQAEIIPDPLSTGKPNMERSVFHLF